MTDDNYQKLAQLIQTVKDIVEVINDKVEKLELFASVTNSQIRLIKDQQSVMNKKLDNLAKTVQEIEDTQNDRLLPSVVIIEKDIKVYSDMYKLNNDNLLKLEKRLEPLEDKSGINPPQNSD